MLGQTKEKRGVPVAAIVAAIAVLFCGGGAAWYLTRPVTKQADGPASAESKAYVKNLRLAGVEMKATDSFASQRLVEILGKIGNMGDRPLQQVDLNCVFSDPNGQIIFREKVGLVKARNGPLKPGETREFRLPFDTIPSTWNQALPQLVIAQIVFE